MIKVFSKVLGGTFKEPAGPTQKGSDWPNNKKKDRTGRKRIVSAQNQKGSDWRKIKKGSDWTKIKKGSDRQKKNRIGPKRITPAQKESDYQSPILSSLNLSHREFCHSLFGK